MTDEKIIAHMEEVYGAEWLDGMKADDQWVLMAFVNQKTGQRFIVEQLAGRWAVYSFTEGGEL